jgi:hypothetical protein
MDGGDLPMTQAFNIYCDENRYLEHDRQKVIVLGLYLVSASESHNPQID